jgi:hypothetical protein
LTAIYGYFEQALRRPRTRVDGSNIASFKVECSSSRIEAAEYSCVTCVTLIGLCEHVREWVMGRSLTEVSELSPRKLLSLHPEIPESHHHRAQDAICALRASLPL